jgi:hypothetical protein
LFFIVLELRETLWNGAKTTESIEHEAVRLGSSSRPDGLVPFRAFRFQTMQSKPQQPYSAAPNRREIDPPTHDTMRMPTAFSIVLRS